MFFDEEMLLDLRLNVMNKYVDKFVITESAYMHSGKSKKLIFDIGMYDGSDTRYYLNEGFRVLAIEANPVLVKRARELIFQEEMDVSF